MRVGPCIPVEMPRLKAEVGPTSGPTWRLSHYWPTAVATSAQTHALGRAGHVHELGARTTDITCANRLLMPRLYVNRLLMPRRLAHFGRVLWGYTALTG
jgi:hypothetical protein